MKKSLSVFALFISTVVLGESSTPHNLQVDPALVAKIRELKQSTPRSSSSTLEERDFINVVYKEKPETLSEEFNRRRDRMDDSARESFSQKKDLKGDGDSFEIPQTIAGASQQ